MGRILVRLLRKSIIAVSLLSVFHYGAAADTLPNVTAQAWVVADRTGNILKGVNTEAVRPIASITKLMTAMVVLDTELSFEEPVATLHGKQLTRLQLLDLAIVHSDNAAADLLCKTYKPSYSHCIAAMNAKAEELGMTNTRFVDATGLNQDNVSTAEDLLKLVSAASGYYAIVAASNKHSLKLYGKRNRVIEFYNTNPTVGKGINFFVSKTGFIRKAGGCIVMMLDTIRGPRMVVVLGSRNTATRIPEAQLISVSY